MSYKTPNAIILEQLATKPTLYGLATLGRFRQEIFRLFVTNKMLNKYCEFFQSAHSPFRHPRLSNAGSSYPVAGGQLLSMRVCVWGGGGML